MLEVGSRLMLSCGSGCGRQLVRSAFVLPTDKNHTAMTLIMSMSSPNLITALERAVSANCLQEIEVRIDDPDVDLHALRKLPDRVQEHRPIGRSGSQIARREGPQNSA